MSEDCPGAGDGAAVGACDSGCGTVGFSPGLLTTPEVIGEDSPVPLPVPLEPPDPPGTAAPPGPPLALLLSSGAAPPFTFGSGTMVSAGATVVSAPGANVPEVFLRITGAWPLYVVV